MLAPVAFYGEYSLLTNTPTDVSFFYNDAGYVTYQDILDKVDASNLSEVAFNGDYASLNNTPQNLSYFNNDVGYLSEHQDISGKENILKDIKSLAASGTISLTDNSINKITATGTVTFSLPSVVSTKYHQILVLLTMSTVRTINLGTTHYFTGEAPDLTKAGLYNIIYEYNGTYWVVGAIYKGTS